MPPKLAVAIPSFNRAAILDKILWNIGPQIQRHHPQSVCYIIDNDSTDDTAEIVRQHSERWPGIFYRKNDKNLGLVRNIAQAIHIPDAEWVWLLGDDDVPMPWGVGELLAEVTEIESRCDNAVFLLMNGAKVDGARRLCVDSWRYSGRPDEVLTIYDRGAEVVEEGIHSIAWLSKLAVQRKFWDQARFNELFRETDLYTFVRVLLETSGRHRAAYTKKLYVLATDEGSRSYYHSKTAIARVCEFPEIERMLVEIFGVPKARRLLQKERKNWLTERGLFAAKIGVFSDEYAEQIQFLQNPISPFWEERLLVRIVYLLTSIAPLKKFLKNWYFRSRGQPEGKLTSINRAS